MSILYKQQIVRTSGYLSDEETENNSFLSHNENILSKHARNWCKLALTDYNSMIVSMEKYLKSEESIKSIEQFSKDYLECLNYGLNNQDNFSTREFLKRTNFRNLKNEIKIQKNGNVDNKSSISQLINRCADTTLAIVKTGIYINKRFDEKRVFKLLNLLQDSFLHGKEKFKVDGIKYLERPFILNMPCVMDAKHCLEREVNVTDENSIKTNGEKENCPCNDFIEKNQNCNCEDDISSCECNCDEECVDQNPCCAEIKPYIAELFIVKDEVACYKPGEMSYIENVIKDEIRVREHRHLQREETYNEYEEENNTFEERDTQVDERFSLHKEIEKVVDTDLSIDAGATYSSGNEKTPTSFTASLDVSYNQSKKDARKIVQDESKNVITKALKRVENKVRTLTSRRMINEIEEKNKHTFGGTKGATEDMSRQFYFVNQERKGQVYSHGLREMLDFYIPDPSLRLKSLMEKEFDLKKPIKPCVEIEQISPRDYLKYVQCYGFNDLEKLNIEPKTLKLFVKGDNPVVGKNKEQFTINETQTFIVPEGYIATELKIDGYNSTHRDEEFWSKVFMAVGSGNVYLEHNDGYSWDTANSTKLVSPLGNLEGTNTLSITNWNVTTYNITLYIKCVPHPSRLLQWQLDVYKKIEEKYNKDLEAYNKAFEEFQQNKQDKFNKNPFMLSVTIQEQLKHSALEYITCQFFDDKNGMRNKVKPCGLPQMDIPETAEFAKRVRFFEQAFEWKFMSYMLYPYFWSSKCSWEDKLNEETPNGLFQKFLQSGYARVSISVRPGYEALVNYFLTTKQIWGGSGVPPLTGATYLPIHQEIKESKDNFNADRNGYLTWDNSIVTGLLKDEIILKDNSDYYDVILPFAFNQTKADVDKDREVFIDCVRYRIISIQEISGEVVLKLDRELEHKDQVDFDNLYLNKNIPWSTGALFVGAPWKFTVPTSLTWLREDGGCLPCYPINCEK